jgi:hypothetical protein
MRCEVCHGSGKMRLYISAVMQARMWPAHYIGHDEFPCFECGGSGVASCCDTAGAAQSVQEDEPKSH